MQFIVLLLLVYVVWKFRKSIFRTLTAKASSARYNDSNILEFCLGGVLTQLTDRERILFRDNFDLVYRRFTKVRLSAQSIDITRVSVLADVSEAFNQSEINEEAAQAIQRTLVLIEETAKKAPQNYERHLSVSQIYLFLKESI